MYIVQVRHAQGVHNVEGDKDHSAYMNPDFFDARVTPLGWNQVKFLISLLHKYIHDVWLLLIGTLH